MPDPKDRRRRKYAEYDPFKAQDVVNENKGTNFIPVERMEHCPIPANLGLGLPRVISECQLPSWL